MIFSPLLAILNVMGTTNHGKCTFQSDTGFEKGRQVPGHRNDPAATAQACCDLCAGIQGCAGAEWIGGQCYYKLKSEMKARPLKGGTAVYGTWTPQPPAPPPPACTTYKTQAACVAAKGEKCVWVNGKCNKPAPPTPPPKPPPAPLPPLPPTPHSPACSPGEKPVQVFILMGQSNMLGEGKKAGNTNGTLQYAVQVEHKYQYLWDAATGNYSTSKNVRNVFVMGSGGMSSAITLQHNEFMTAATTKPASFPGMTSKAKDVIGPELGIGFTLSNYTSGPVMTLKSCIGNRALGWDLLPPTTKRSSFVDSKNETYIYAGYHDSPEKWLEGSVPVPNSWAAGIQYDGDIHRASIVLGNLSSFYPGATCYEVAGFFWWQGDRDSRDMGLSTHYEANLVTLIEQLRLQFNAPHAKFVTASLGQTVRGSTGGDGLILDAMEAVANATKYPAFKGNVAAVYTHPLEHKPGASGSHYGGDAETYMNVGQAMGMAMVKLLQADEMHESL